MPIKKDIPVTAKKMFDNYLYRSKLNKRKMHPIQLAEMEKVHYAALSSLLVLFSQKNYSETELFNIVTQMENDVQEFWNTFKTGK